MDTNPVEQETGPWRTNALGFLLLLFLAALLISYGWTKWLLPPFNSEHLGPDACHHAILIYCQTLPDQDERAAIAGIMIDYPQMSHWLAAQVMSLFGNDPYKGMRAVSFASVLFLFICQFALFRVFLKTWQAVLGLLSWQLLCYLCNLGNPQYYCAAYFFAQAVGMAAVWLAVVLFTLPMESRAARLVLGLLGSLLAAFAYLCHIVPGVVVFGGLGLYSVIRLVGRPNLDDALRILLLVIIGLAVILGTNQLALMSRGRSVGGTVPVKNYLLLLTWVPTLVAAILMRWRDWRTANRGDRGKDVIDGLVCLLATAGGLQAYCALEWLVGKSSSYTVLKFFYILFPVSSLLWFLWAARLWRSLPLSKMPRSLTGWGARLTSAGLIGLLIWLQMKTFVRSELWGPCSASPRRYPVEVVRRLEQQLQLTAGSGKRMDRGDLLYYDPTLPQSSVFVNMVALHRSLDDAYTTKDILRDWKAGIDPLPAKLKQQIHFTRLLLPERETGKMPADSLAGGLPAWPALGRSPD